MEDKKVILKVTNLKTHFDVTKGLFAKKQICLLYTSPSPRDA